MIEINTTEDMVVNDKEKGWMQDDSSRNNYG